MGCEVWGLGRDPIAFCCTSIFCSSSFSAFLNASSCASRIAPSSSSSLAFRASAACRSSRAIVIALRSSGFGGAGAGGVTSGSSSSSSHSSESTPSWSSRPPSGRPELPIDTRPEVALTVDPDVRSDTVFPAFEIMSSAARSSVPWIVLDSSLIASSSSCFSCFDPFTRSSAASSARANHFVSSSLRNAWASRSCATTSPCCAPPARTPSTRKPARQRARVEKSKSLAGWKSQNWVVSGRPTTLAILRESARSDGSSRFAFVRSDLPGRS